MLVNSAKSKPKSKLEENWFDGQDLKFQALNGLYWSCDPVIKTTEKKFHICAAAVWINILEEKKQSQMCPDAITTPTSKDSFCKRNVSKQGF